MDIEEYKKLFRFEEDNWWYKAKRRLIFGFLKDIIPKGRSVKLLDVGCGTGINASYFSKLGDTYAVDYSEEALKFCRTRNLENLKKASATKLPFKNSTFDIVGCFDVLYHKAIRKDTKVIKEIYRVLKKGGYFIFTDSAMMCLWSKHDIIQHSRTRYSRKEIEKKIRAADFDIKKLSYYYCLIFPRVYIARKIDNILNKDKQPKLNIYNTNKMTNHLLDILMSLEYILIKKINLPFGSSIFCIAKKK